MNSTDLNSAEKSQSLKTNCRHIWINIRYPDGPGTEGKRICNDCKEPLGNQPHDFANYVPNAIKTIMANNREVSLEDFNRVYAMRLKETHTWEEIETLKRIFHAINQKR